MAGGAKARKRVEADAGAGAASSSMLRAKDGSAFAKCDECKKDVPVALIGFHSCSLDAKIKTNLEAQVIEKAAEVKRKPADRKKPSSEPKSKKAKKNKDPNMPKRPPTAFFLFMDEFRKTYKEENPDSKGVKEVAKQGGEKWKSMTDDEKKPFMEKASELKAEYEKAVEAYNAGNGAAEDEGGASDKEEDKEDAENGVEEEVSDPE